MGLTQIQKIQLNKQVDKILHTPGNQPQAEKNQLEMAFVLDCSASEEFLKSTLTDAVAGLKAHDKIFQNVRSNVVYWGREQLTTEVMPMSFLQMGKPFTQEAYKTVDNAPIFDNLCAYLKLYHARSKCILVFTEKEYEIQDAKQVYDSLNPFLKTKLLLVTPQNFISGTVINMEMLQEKC